MDLVWLIPFSVAFVIFPLRVSMMPLFESIMPLVLTIVVSNSCLLLYKEFRC